MLAVQGYFDGVAIQPLEQVIAKPNQRVIITIMDEFVDLTKARVRTVCAARCQNMPILRWLKKNRARGCVQFGKFASPCSL